jgi:hypothetical protein
MSNSAPEAEHYQQQLDEPSNTAATNIAPNNNEMNHAGGTVDPDDPLLIAQTLTYVTDNGSVVMSFSSAPFSFGKFLEVQ